MTPEAQRIVIAEVCKWERLGEYSYRLPDGRELHVDILNSLEAVHEAEKMLTPEQQWMFCVELRALLDCNKFEMIHATAAQRADAFIRTLSLWDDSK